MQELKEIIYGLNVTPLSFSKAVTLLHCPQRYYRKYILKEKALDPTTGKPPRGEVPTVVGSFLHSVLESCMKQGIINGYDTIDFLLIWANLIKSKHLLTKEIEHANTFKESTEKLLKEILQIISKNKSLALKPLPELWFNNYVSPTQKQTFGKFLNGSKGLSDPNKFFQGSADLCLISENGWGNVGLIIDYKSFIGDAHNDIWAPLQLLLYVYFLFEGFKNLQSIKYAIGEIPTAIIHQKGVFKREKCEQYEDQIKDFLVLFIDQYKKWDRLNFYPHLKNPYCSFCDYKLNCKRTAKFECYENKDNQLICGKTPEYCYERCINLK